MTKTLAYLDYNASAPLLAEVRAAMMAAMAVDGNPSSVHGPGRTARHAIEQARTQVAAFVGTEPHNIIFTSGGTEANNLAIDGLIRHKRVNRIIVSGIEHPSVLEAIASWRTSGVEIVELPCGIWGRVDVARIADLLSGAGDAAPATLICLMAGNNETGVLQDVAAAVAIARDFGALVFSDAVQAAGKLALDFDGLGLDLMSVSAHKLGGPKGIGALVVRKGLDLAPSLRGGGQEMRHRAGTENLMGIAGFGAVARLASDRLDAWAATAGLRDNMESRIKVLLPDVRIFGAEADRLPNTSCFACAGVVAESQVIAMDLRGYAISAGSACSSGKMVPSAALKAMGASEEEAACAIRVSLGPETTKEEVDGFIAAWSGFIRKQTELGLKRSA